MPSFAQTDGSNSLLERMVLLIFDKSVKEKDRQYDMDRCLFKERDQIVTCALTELQHMKVKDMKFASIKEEENRLKMFQGTANTVEYFLKTECNVDGKETSAEYIIDLFYVYQDFVKQEALQGLTRHQFRMQLFAQKEIYEGGKRRIDGESPKACACGLKLKEKRCKAVELNGTVEQ